MLTAAAIVGDELEGQISAWLAGARAAGRPAKVVIAPHAGHRYSGPTIGHAFGALAGGPAAWARIVVVGPSHRAHLPSALMATPFASVATPLGPITVDVGGRAAFAQAARAADEGEHSMELLFPFIKHCFPQATVLPLLAGHVPTAPGALEGAAALLVPLLRDPATAVVVSSDFCHWGANYSYSPSLSHYGGGAPMSERIRALDSEAVAHIATGDAAALEAYLERTGNTICGRSGILLLMAALQMAGMRGEWELLDYQQSTALGAYAPDMRASSVSYVAAAFHTLP